MQEKCRRRVALTTHRVAKLTCDVDGKQEVIWDDPAGPRYVPGLHVVVYPSGRAIYFVRVPAPATRSRYRTAKLGSRAELTAERARAMALDVLAQARLGVAVPVSAPGSMTVDEAARRFLAEYRTGGVGGAPAKARPVAELASWRRNLARLIERLGKSPLVALTTRQLQQVVDDLPQATARVCRSNWSTMWQYAIAERWVPGDIPNPAARVSIQACERTVGRRKRHLDAATVALAIETAEASRRPLLAHYLRVLSLTGHRPGELLRARWEDVHEGRVLVRDTKKGRDIALPPNATPALEDALAQLRALTGDMVGLFGDDATREAAHRQYRALAAQWARMTQPIAELREVRLKHFRSTVASQAYEAAHREALRDAQDALQHRAPRVTEEAYVVR